MRKGYNVLKNSLIRINKTNLTSILNKKNTLANMDLKLTDLLKQSSVPLYRSGLFIIRVLITSAGVPSEAATKPEQILK